MRQARRAASGSTTAATATQRLSSPLYPLRFYTSTQSIYQNPHKATHARRAQSTKPHTGQEKPIPAPPQAANKQTPHLASRYTTSTVLPRPLQINNELSDLILQEGLSRLRVNPAPARRRRRSETTVKQSVVVHGRPRLCSFLGCSVACYIACYNAM